MQQPVKALQTLRGTAVEWKNKSISSEETFPVKGQVLELDADLIPPTAGICGIRLAAGDGKYIIIRYDAAGQQLTVDRSNTGNINFDNQFARVSSASTRVPLQEGKLRLHAFLDKSILEVYANDGAVVLTTQLFPAPNLDGVVFFSEKGATRITSAKVWPLRSSWH